MAKILSSPAKIEICSSHYEMGVLAADKIIHLIKNYPDAVIVLPTGDTPKPMYNELVKKFEQDRSIDFSKVKFFNLDEYIGLPKNHPLSYSYYMEKLFYEKLDKIDSSRAPKKENRNLPFVSHGEKPNIVAKKYSLRLQQAIKNSGREKIDLVVVGIGGAYPKGNSSKALKGGHIGFNEPGTKLKDKTRVVSLSKKTMLDTSFRFFNLRFCKRRYDGVENFSVPKKAITIGISEILNSREILLLANGEEKMPVIKNLYESKPTKDFPATYLKYHENVKWILDRDAASQLPHVKTPWICSEKFRWSKEIMRHAVIEVLKKYHKIPLSKIKEYMIEDLKIPFEQIERFGGINQIIKDLSNFLKFSIHTEKNRLLPKNERILIFSPHPDDDVITMGATIKKLLELGNDIWIVYLVNGENSVRDDFKKVREKYIQLIKESKETKMLQRRKDEYLRLAQIKVRQEEAQKATSILGIQKEKLIFLNLPYYYNRGFVDINPIDYEKDVKPLMQLILQIRPKHIFYSAEADPHGAHGLGAKIISMAFEKLSQFWNETFWGYRGAYEEWAINRPEEIIIVPFGKNEMQTKIKCIKSHESQINPIFPSFDNRQFWERARDRNRLTGRLLEQMGYLKGNKNFAEIFRPVSYANFVRINR